MSVDKKLQDIALVCADNMVLFNQFHTTGKGYRKCRLVTLQLNKMLKELKKDLLEHQKKKIEIERLSNYL